ncbi:DUF2975 domain-containing protein [Paenibacillus sp. LHD-117]|uniref:DUF2975 domain-containing protein n=1 Tax=Paenibacillus sp. LHD-117 TaxID=3071412 RepID=UPI0027E07449|nr:DUF2975 domain-containing protein [Paenibacillus sp. LHD-117]MDQ6422254.1 DUF2975 domain-containing protein [Paenibacillus sp. LHD-117]
MKQGSTFFLQAVVVLIGIAVLAVCVFLLPGVASRDAEANPRSDYLQYPFLVCSYILSILFLFAMVQTFKLLSYINRRMAFSALSVRALRDIKRSATLFSCLIVGGILFVIIFLEGDRAGVVAAGIIGTFASIVIATFAAVLQKLLQDALAIKSENDLTV